MLTLLMAWRNLFRNKRRSFVTLLTVSSCTVILILTWALVKGFVVQFESNITNLTLGEAQMHAPEYRLEQGFWDAIEKPDEVLAWAKTEGIDACPRSYGYGLGASGSKSAGTRYWGVDPSKEKDTFDLAGHILEGSFLDKDSRGEVVLGRKLARSLNVEVGGELIALVQCADGSLGNELYTVKGILKTVGERDDRSAAILNMADFEELFYSHGMVHEIAFNSHGGQEPDQLAAVISGKFPEPETLSWKGLMPAMKDFGKLTEGMTMIFLMIYCIAAAAGVLNTQLMSTFDRMREFGVLKAIGTPPWRIVRDVAAEASLIGLVGVIVGLVIAWPLYWALHTQGIDTSQVTEASMSISGVAFDPIWKGFIGVREVFQSALMMWVFCVVAAIYPAILASRLDPVAAIRHRR